ncbi:hypothetical protein ACIBG8_29395 [Nonomuraea sp. NPDC050556]|uniref:hypothetical protein n=1 Tax=Nonomuraea sp. NPDC050556 TaxID=3364369 RepID=UPI0037A2B4AB
MAFVELRERLLIQVSARDVYDAVQLAGHPGSGLLFTGQAAHDAIRMVRRHGYDGPVMADRRRYAGSARIRGTARLSPHWIADQVEAGATAVLTDSGYVGDGDHEALAAILDQATGWDGAVAVLPVHPRWVTRDRELLLGAVRAYGGPVALVVEDGPPYTQLRSLRRYEPLSLPLMSAGVAAFGALACGAEWAAIGVREVLRHLYPEPHAAVGGWRRGGARSAFVAERLEFVPVERLRRETCACSTCGGRAMRWMRDASELEVNTHNSKALHAMHVRLLRSHRRQAWWSQLTQGTGQAVG